MVIIYLKLKQQISFYRNSKLSIAHSLNKPRQFVQNIKTIDKLDATYSHTHTGY